MDYLRLMDQYHIEAACVMPFNDPYMLSMDFQAGSVHNNLLAMCLQAENCLFCFADIDIRNPVETTLELLEKALEQKNSGRKNSPHQYRLPRGRCLLRPCFRVGRSKPRAGGDTPIPGPISRMMSVPPHASGMLSGTTPHCAFPWRMPAGSNTRNSSVSACTSISPLC